MISVITVTPRTRLFDGRKHPSVVPGGNTRNEDFLGFQVDDLNGNSV